MTKIYLYSREPIKPEEVKRFYVLARGLKLRTAEILNVFGLFYIRIDIDEAVTKLKHDDASAWIEGELLDLRFIPTPKVSEVATASGWFPAVSHPGLPSSDDTIAALSEKHQRAYFESTFRHHALASLIVDIDAEMTRLGGLRTQVDENRKKYHGVIDLLHEQGQSALEAKEQDVIKRQEAVRKSEEAAKLEEYVSNQREAESSAGSREPEIKNSGGSEG